MVVTSADWCHQCCVHQLVDNSWLNMEGNATHPIVMMGRVNDYMAITRKPCMHAFFSKRFPSANSDTHSGLPKST